MNKIILGTFFALCCLAAVRGLSCNVCKFRVWSFCFISSSTAECASPGQCATISASVGSVSFFKKLECKSNCSKVDNANDATFGFNYTTSCCTIDLCNSASAAKLTPFLGFTLAFIWLIKLI